LLGVAANSSQLPDVDGVELKAYRRGSSAGQGKLVTLFSKTPEWAFPGKGVELLRRYGYNDPRGRRSLYCTIMRSRNSLGFSLNLRNDAKSVHAIHNEDLVLSYSLGVLEKRLKEKHPATLFIIADSRGAGAAEEFRYGQVVLHREPAMPNFLDLMEDNAIGLDLTLHLKPNGSARDHGYLWRIREPKLPALFAYKKQLMT
jgi:hypothetical protein